MNEVFKLLERGIKVTIFVYLVRVAGVLTMCLQWENSFLAKGNNVHWAFVD